MRTCSFAAALLAAVALTACATGGTQNRSESITVSAAASLTEAFTELGHSFEHTHPGSKVTFNFAGSSMLVTQIRNRAPVDVFASADDTTMRRLVDDHLVVGRPMRFARNQLAIVVAKDNPKRIRRLADLARPELVVAVCAPAVPCGALAAKAIARSGAAVKPSTQEDNVKSVVTRVATGEADAGIVYVTDAKAAGRALTTVPIPFEQNATTNCSIAVVAASTHTRLDRAFVSYVGSSSGRATLRRSGFLGP